jgi:hypothetical protein
MNKYQLVNPYHLTILRTDLTRGIPSLIPGVFDEMTLAMSETLNIPNGSGTHLYLAISNSFTGDDWQILSPSPSSKRWFACWVRSQIEPWWGLHCVETQNMSTQWCILRKESFYTPRCSRFALHRFGSKWFIYFWKGMPLTCSKHDILSIILNIWWQERRAESFNAFDEGAYWEQ